MSSVAAVEVPEAHAIGSDDARRHAEPLPSLDGPILGPSLGHEHAAAFAVALRERDYMGALDAYTAASSWEDRAFCIEHAAESGIELDVLDVWRTAWPEHVLPALVRGACLLHAGQSMKALTDLRSAVRIEDGNPIPWTHLLRIAHMEQTSTDELQEILSELLSREALYQGHIEYLRGLSASSGGSTDQMISFASMVCRVVPSGSALRALLAVAVVEAILAERPSDHIAFLDERGLIDDLLMAAGQSVFHPDFAKVARIPRIKAMNSFVVALSMVGHEDLALVLADRLGGAVAGWPLEYLGSPIEDAWRALVARLKDRAAEAADDHDRGGRLAG